MGRIKWFDAVRAYGLFLVLLYHLFFDILPGGFLGVDVFLTFSGFLITANIIEEIRRSGRFAFFDYCIRRIKRILIPLFFAVAFTLPFLLLISPDYSMGIARQTAAALSFVTNWFQILTGGSYEAQMLPSYYVHTWTLAILMQLYLAWGLVCAVLSRIAKAFYPGDHSRELQIFRRAVILVSGAAAYCSFAYLLHMHQSGRTLDEIYFSTFARSFSFLMGSCAAAIRGIYIRQGEESERKRFVPLKTIVLLLFTLSAAFVVFYCSVKYKFDDEFIYRYGFLLTAFMTLALIYGTLGLHMVTPAHMKEPRLLTAIADISYNAYLYHWPIYIAICAIIGKNPRASFVTLGLTFLISALMLYKGERVFVPQGSNGALKHRKAGAIVLGIALVGSMLSGGIAIYKAPEITSMERDFAAGYVAQDAKRAIRTGSRLESINKNPLAYGKREEIALVYDPLRSEMEVIRENSVSQLDSYYDEIAVETYIFEESPPQEQYTTSVETGFIWESGTSAQTGEIPDGVTIIGCSVVLGASAMLQESIPNCYVDAEVSRQLGAGYSLMMELQDNGELREYVVIALGTNVNSLFETLITSIISDLNPGHRLIFVTPFDGRYLGDSSTSLKTAIYIRELPALYPFVTVADWHSLISTQTSLLASDIVHMGGDSSRKLLTNCIMEALEIAAEKPAK